MIELGDEARDTITGFEGVVIARTEWLYSCVRVSLQPRTLDRDGKVPESQTFDEPQLELVRKANQPVLKRANGGPRPEPSRHGTPSQR